MPLIIANILRPVIIWVVQQGATLAVFAVLEKVLDYLQEWVRDGLGISEDDSRAIIANYAIDAIAYVGAGAAIIYSKAPTTLARKIGLSGGKPVKQKVTATAEQKVASATPEIVAKTGTSIFKKLAIVVGGITGLIWLGVGVANVVEPGIYKAKQANDVWEKFIGIRPFPEPNPLESPGPFTPGEFTDYARSLETAGILGLEYPLGSFLYTKENLAKLVDYVAGIEAGKGKTVTAKSIVTAIAPYLVMPNKSSTQTTTPVKTTTTTPALTVPKVQVFTGVLSQGVLGKGLEFQARPDDLIENAQEMLDAASNNLAPFIASLPNRITYQVKVVNSITTKDGFTQKGSITQILTGYSTTGAPKYKTVVNKFAVLDIFILNDKNSRVKITSIVLGPVDSVKFQVGQGTITAIETGLQKVASTSNINDIKGISTSAPLTVLTPSTTPTTAPATQLHFVIGRYGSSEVWTTEMLNNPSYGGKEVSYSEWKANTQKSINTSLAGVNEFIAQAERTSQPVVTPSAPVSSPSGGSLAPSAPVVSAPVVQAPTPQPAPAPVVKKGASATNLSEWYTANGQSLPSISQRATLYQQYGLGQASYYTGTAEQNTNLLNKLKSL